LRIELLSFVDEAESDDDRIGIQRHDEGTASFYVSKVRPSALAAWECTGGP
jgi:hypothetical protein